MPNLDNWLKQANSTGLGISISDRAVDAWRRINDNPAMVHSIVLYRYGVAQAAQTVRVEFAESGSEVSDSSDTARKHRIIATLFGVVGHPDATIPDADVQVDDEFGIAGVDYRVVQVLPYAGEIQAQIVRVE